ncbi:MAG: DUF4202 family protein [Acidobacteriota bacterium]
MIGHVTRDLIGGEERLGGGAAYVARALSACGMDVALVTSAPDDRLLQPIATDPRIRLHRLPSESFTTLDHHCTAGQRQLTLVESAANITAADIPSAWRDLPFVCLVPVMGECGTELLTAFPESELIVGAQGWLRRVEAGGLVISCPPPEALLAARLLAVTLSEGDHPEAEALARRMARHCRLVALTRGDKAVTIFEKSGETDIPIAPVKPVHGTNGAGGVFTALLGLRIMGGDTVRRAVTGAARGAAHYVAEGMAGLGKLQAADSAQPSSRRAKSCIRALIARSEVPEDPRHADNALEWLLHLEPDVGQALQLAALAHDIDRATPERVRREDHPDYDAFKAAHARRGARLLRGLLEDCGVESAIVEEACRLVAAHEVGGDPGSDLLKDADSISFFDVNLPLYFQREGWDEAKRRSHWGYRRLTPRAQEIVKHIDHQDKELARLLREVIHESVS